MGGKSKILDPKQLAQLYVESKKFSNKANDGVSRIQGELARLNDPTFQSGLTGGQGEAAKQAIASITRAVKELKGVLDKTSSFIDSKLASAQQLARDKHGFADAGTKATNVSNNMNLKR